MITPEMLFGQNETAQASDVKACRARAAGAGRSAYGAENLPVLIRLPDLTTPRGFLGAARTPDAAACGLRLADTPDSDEMQPGVPEPLAAADSAGAENEPASHARVGHRARRENKSAKAARSSGGVGQFLFAVVLAGALFAVIVTVKEWNRAPRAKQPSMGADQVGTPTVQFESFIPPELTPPAPAAPTHREIPLDTVLTSHEPIAPDAAGYADGLEQARESMVAYPSTEMQPVRPQYPVTGSADGAWPAATTPGPIRHADRQPDGGRYK